MDKATHENLILKIYFAHMIHINYHVVLTYMYTVKLNNCVRGYNIYKDNWTARVNEVLSCAREHGNRNSYAVVIKKDSSAVGHVPRVISYVCTILATV